MALNGQPWYHHISLIPMVLLKSGLFEERIVWGPKKILKILIFFKTVKGTHDMTSNNTDLLLFLLPVHTQLLTPPGDGQGSLACCSPWGRKESDMTE